MTIIFVFTVRDPIKHRGKPAVKSDTPQSEIRSDLKGYMSRMNLDMFVVLLLLYLSVTHVSLLAVRFRESKNVSH
jgi:hypothetical protein